MFPFPARCVRGRGVLLSLSLLAMQAQGGEPCPDLSGRYHLVGEPQAVDLVLAALASPRDSAIALQGPVRGELTVTLRDGLSADWPTGVGARLREGRDFRCADGQLQLDAPTAHWRSEDERWYSGSATVDLSRHPDGGLQLRVRFEGSERVTVYAYDSARASVPKPFSGRRFDERLYWPAWSADDDRIRRPPPPEPAPVQALRRQLDSRVLGSVQMGTPEAVAGGMLVRFTAPRSQEVIAFEDRLQAAGIRYESREAPVWTNNRYEMTFLIDGSGRGGASLPSPLRVEHALRRLAWPLAELVSVNTETGSYVATLRLTGNGDTETLLARLREHATLFAEISPLDGDAATRPGADLRLRLRPR